MNCSSQPEPEVVYRKRVAKDDRRKESLWQNSAERDEKFSEAGDYLSCTEDCQFCRFRRNKVAVFVAAKTNKGHSVYHEEA